MTARRRVATVLGTVGLGVVLGVLWWAAAPLARADVVQGQAYLIGHPELEAAQDGWFAVVTGVGGVLAAAALALRPGRREAAAAAIAPVLALVVAVLAWRTGVLLGPSSLATQVAGGDLHPTTPLQLHSYGALLVGPFLLCVTRFLAALFSAEPGTAPGP